MLNDNKIADNLINDVLNQIVNSTKPVSVNIQKNKIFDPFDIPDDKLFNDDKIIRKSVNICSDCNIEMHKSSKDMAYICDKCGNIEEMISNDTDTPGENSNGFDMICSYNTSDLSAAPIRISGPNNYIYQKKLVSSTSNYKKTQKKNTVDQMVNYIYQYKGSTPPKRIVLEAADLYYDVQQHCIKRGDVRKGTMAACLYRKCIEYNINRKPKEISDIFGIPQSEISNGEKILDELIASGLIKLKDLNKCCQENMSADEKQIHAFLNQYFERLNIPIDELGDVFIDRPNYKEFAYKLIRFTQKYRIAESSIISSKCAGVIYIISKKRKELNINRNMIEVACSISKSTFGRFEQSVVSILNSDEIKNKKIKSRLRNLYKKFNIL